MVGIMFNGFSLHLLSLVITGCIDSKCILLFLLLIFYLSTLKTLLKAIVMHTILHRHSP